MQHETHWVLKKQPNTDHCFVCGIENEWGIKARFFETDHGEIVSLFTPTFRHQGYPGRLHGGIATAILDETIGRAVLIGAKEEQWGVTVELSVTFRILVPLDQELRVVGRIVDSRRRFFHGTGELLLPDGKIAVTARGRYLRVPLDKIADFAPEELGWRVSPHQEDPESIPM